MQCFLYWYVLIAICRKGIAFEIMEHYKNLSLKNILGEVWEDIKGLEGWYQVSNKGRFKSKGWIILIGKNKEEKHYSDRILRQPVDKKGYLRINFSKKGKYLKALSHRIVAITFIPNPENKPQVNHKKGIKTDNRVSQLEWATQTENIRHGYAIGLFTKDTKGSKSCHAKKIIQYDLNMNKIKEWDSIIEAAQHINSPYPSLWRILTGKYPSFKGYIFKYSEVKTKAK